MADLHHERTRSYVSKGIPRGYLELTYSPNLPTAGQIVRESSRKDQANDDRGQYVNSIHAESVDEDVKEGIPCRVGDGTVNVDDDKKVADQEYDREDSTEKVRSDHCRGDCAPSILKNKVRR